MAAVKISTPSTSSYSFFKTLKDGALLPFRNRSLFAAVFALSVAYTSFFILLSNLADLDIQPHTDAVKRDVMAFIDGTDVDELDRLLYDLGKDTWSLVRAAAANVLLTVTVGNAVWIIALSAAVATYASEKTCSFGELLGKARAQLKSTTLTLAFVYGLRVAYDVLLMSAMVALLVLSFVFLKRPTGLPTLLLLLLGWLLFEAAAVFLVYFIFVSEFSVVVAVAEPGRHSASAVVRAWRLLRGRKWRSVLFIAMVQALIFACSRAFDVARTRVGSSQASGLLLEFLYGVAMAAVELFAVCAMTAFYYECKERDDDAATTAEFVKLPNEEFICA